MCECVWHQYESFMLHAPDLWRSSAGSCKVVWMHPNRCTSIEKWLWSRLCLPARSWCVTVCCSVLQCAAAWCTVLEPFVFTNKIMVKRVCVCVCVHACEFVWVGIGGCGWTVGVVWARVWVRARAHVCVFWACLHTRLTASKSSIKTHHTCTRIHVHIHAHAHTCSTHITYAPSHILINILFTSTCIHACKYVYMYVYMYTYP